MKENTIEDLQLSHAIEQLVADNYTKVYMSMNRQQRRSKEGKTILKQAERYTQSLIQQHVLSQLEESMASLDEQQ